jgi:hypothetical protein
MMPLKRVVTLLGVSRASLWRASKSGIPGFPPPITLRGRVYWRENDLPVLKAALLRYQGRYAFEHERRLAKLRAARSEARSDKKKKRPASLAASGIRQPDLFGAVDAMAPGGAEARR